MSAPAEKTRGEDRLTPVFRARGRRPGGIAVLVRRLQEARRVLRYAVQPDLEMQMRSGRAAGRSHRRDALAADDEVAFADEHLRAVRVARNEHVAVVDL